MKFLTKMWHPNSKLFLNSSPNFVVYPDGKVCISILHPPGTDQFNSGETADERWRPILGVESIILSVISMLNDPNISSPANIDAAVEYRDNRESYIKKVRKLTIQSVDSL
jgi:ubiquitin-conjugating enzyme E2 G1